MTIPNNFALGYDEVSKYSEIIKGCLPEGLFVSESDESYSHHLLLQNKARIILYYDKNGHVTLNLNGCSINTEKVKSLLQSPLSLDEDEKGKRPFPKTWKFKIGSPKISIELKRRVLEQLPVKTKGLPQHQ